MGQSSSLQLRCRPIEPRQIISPAPSCTSRVKLSHTRRSPKSAPFPGNDPVLNVLSFVRLFIIVGWKLDLRQLRAAPRAEIYSDKAASAIVHDNAETSARLCDQGIWAIEPVGMLRARSAQVESHSFAAILHGPAAPSALPEHTGFRPRTRGADSFVFERAHGDSAHS